MTSADGVVGSIQPSPDGGAPLFKILRRECDPSEPNVRPCEHARYTLDEKFATVTCGKCGEHVDPFSVLLRFAEWQEKWKRDMRAAQGAEQRLHIEELRRLRGLRATTQAEAAEINAALDKWAWNTSEEGLEALRGLRNRIGDAVRGRQGKARDDRRAKSCAHKWTHWTRVVSAEGDEDVQYCSACGIALGSRPHVPGPTDGAA